MAYLSLLSFKDNKATINNECIVLLKWYQGLVNISEDEEQVMEYVKYIYLAADYGSPFIEIKDDFRRCSKALENTTLTKEDVNQTEVLYALEEYDALMTSDTQMGFVTDLYAAINSTRNYLRTVDYTKLIESGARKGTPLHSPKDVMSMAKDAEKVINSLEALKIKIIDNVKNRQLEDAKKSTKVRGDRERGYMSRMSSKIS